LGGDAVGLWKEAGILAVSVGTILFIAGLQGTSATAGTNANASPLSVGSSNILTTGQPVSADTAGTSALNDWTHGWPLGRYVNQGVGSHARPAVTVASPIVRVSPTATPRIETAPVVPPAPVATPISLLLPSTSVLGSSVPDSVRQWEPLIDKYALDNGLDPNLVAAVMMTESAGNPQATSKKGAVGLMQIVNGPYDPETNVRDGTKILANTLKRYGGDLELSLAAYNAGAGAVDRFGGIPPYSETETYIFEVLNRYYLYSAA
jgi:hypothetical protein